MFTELSIPLPPNLKNSNNKALLVKNHFMKWMVVDCSLMTITTFMASSRLMLSLSHKA